MMNNSSYKKLNLVAIGTIIISIIMYQGAILAELFINDLSNKEYVLLIVITIILVVSILGLISGGTSFIKMRKMKSNNVDIPKTHIGLMVLSVIVNFGIVIYSFISLSFILYFVRAWSWYIAKIKLNIKIYGIPYYSKLNMRYFLLRNSKILQSS